MRTRRSIWICPGYLRSRSSSPWQQLGSLLYIVHITVLMMLIIEPPVNRHYLYRVYQCDVSSSQRLSRISTACRVPTHLENLEFGQKKIHASKNLGISKKGHFHGKIMENCFSYPHFFSISEYILQNLFFVTCVSFLA